MARLEKALNKDKIEILLGEWLQNIISSITQSKQNAQKMSEGLNTRITRTFGRPTIFDRECYKKQKNLQKSLSKELPHLKDLIMSEPFLEGYQWKAKDYIDLYHSHYLIVLQKITKVVLDG